MRLDLLTRLKISLVVFVVVFLLGILSGVLNSLLYLDLDFLLFSSVAFWNLTVSLAALAAVAVFVVITFEKP